MSYQNQGNEAPPPVPQQKASGGVIALGVINILYALFFRLCCGVGLLSLPLLGIFLKMAEEQGAEIPPLDMLASGPVRSYFMIGGFVLLTLGFFLIIGGIGLLTLKPWGRSLSIGVAAGEIAWVIIDFIVNFFFILPATAEATGQELPQLAGNVVIGVFFALLKLVYPIILLICLNMELVKRQFEPTEFAAPG